MTHVKSSWSKQCATRSDAVVRDRSFRGRSLAETSGPSQ